MSRTYKSSFGIPPSVDIHMLYHAHAIPEDLGDLGELHRQLEEADVLLLECFGWQDEWLQKHQAIANGDAAALASERKVMESSKAFSVPYRLAFLEVLFECGAEIACADMPVTFPEFDRLFGQLHAVEIAPHLDQFEEEFEFRRNLHKLHLSAQLEREDFILRQIGQVVRPFAALVDDLRVVMPIGCLHLRVGQILSERFAALVASGNRAPVLRETWIPPASFNPAYLELLLKERMGLELTKEDLLNLVMGDRLSDQQARQMENMSVEEIRQAFEKRATAR